MFCCCFLRSLALLPRVGSGRFRLLPQAFTVFVACSIGSCAYYFFRVFACLLVPFRVLWTYGLGLCPPAARRVPAKIWRCPMVRSVESDSLLDRLTLVSNGGFAHDVVPAAAVAAAAGLPEGLLLIPLTYYAQVAVEVSRAIDRIRSASSLSRVEVATGAALYLLDSFRELGLLSQDALVAAREEIFSAAAFCAGSVSKSSYFE